MLDGFNDPGCGDDRRSQIDGHHFVELKNLIVACHKNQRDDQEKSVKGELNDDCCQTLELHGNHCTMGFDNLRVCVAESAGRIV